jgi:bifunctional DNA-binding transcriptional regulator/antitoxin component of YhaV-PrlF toxin-antitoxin module
MATPQFPTDTEDFGCVSLSSQGQLTLPKAAREALKLEGGARVYVFASASERRAWLLITNREGREIARFLAED